MKTQFLLLTLLLTITAYQAHSMEVIFNEHLQAHQRVANLFLAYKNNEPISEAQLNQPSIVSSLQEPIISPKIILNPSLVEHLKTQKPLPEALRIELLNLTEHLNTPSPLQTPFAEALYIESLKKNSDSYFIEYLIKQGADVNKLIPGLPICIPLAAGNPTITELLLKYKASFQIPQYCKHAASLFTVALLHRAISHLYISNLEHQTNSAIEDYSKCIEHLIDAGCPLNDPQKPDSPPLLHQVLCFPSIVKLLLSKEADLNLEYNGRTPLEEAAHYIDTEKNKSSYKESYDLVKEAQDLKDRGWK